MKNLQFHNLAKSLSDSFKALLYPSGVSCNFCGREISKSLSVDICDKCLQNLPYIKIGCDKCGSEVDRAGVCIRCKTYSFDYDKNIAVCNYNNFTVALLFKLKNGHQYISDELAFLMAQAVSKSKINFDVVTSVPISVSTAKKRGYNQSQLLAYSLSCMLKIPADCNLLIKTKDTYSQKRLSANERMLNLSGAFVVRDDAAIKGKTILIADDVLTTGATLSQCARLLKNKGAEKVFAATFVAVKHEISFDTP